MTERHSDKPVSPVMDRPQAPLMPVLRLVALPSVTIVDGRLVAVKQLADRAPSRR